jgi:AP-4 complex subunit epsilon-1
MIVLDCLEDPDETIQRRTLDLLYRMTTPKNVKIVVTKMQQFLKKSKDHFLRKELVQRLTQLAERFAPDAVWSVLVVVVVVTVVIGRRGA